MRALRGRCAAVAATAALAAVVAGGGRMASAADHLLCFKTKDSGGAAARLELRPATGSDFSVATGCRVPRRARELCVAADAMVAAGDVGYTALAGDGISQPFLCYRLRCDSDRTAPSEVALSDGFGAHALTGPATSRLCVPAVYGTVTTTTTTLPTGTPRPCSAATVPACDGQCGNINLACLPDAGACVCQGVDIFLRCGILGGPPDCLGSCEGQQSCIDDGGACVCGLVLD